jgi:hypothetical protein
MTLDAMVTRIIGGGIARLLAQGLIRGLAAGCMGRGLPSASSALSLTAGF